MIKPEGTLYGDGYNITAVNKNITVYKGIKTHGVQQYEIEYTNELKKVKTVVGTIHSGFFRVKDKKSYNTSRFVLLRDDFDKTKDMTVLPLDVVKLCMLLTPTYTDDLVFFSDKHNYDIRAILVQMGASKLSEENKLSTAITLKQVEKEVLDVWDTGLYLNVKKQ